MCQASTEPHPQPCFFSEGSVIYVSTGANHAWSVLKGGGRVSVERLGNVAEYTQQLSVLAWPCYKGWEQKVSS